MNPPSHNQRRPAGASAGFTLLEMLVYLAVITVVLTAAASLSFAFLSANARAMANVETGRNARFAVDRMATAVREAAGVNFSDSVFGLNPGRLSLATGDPATDPTVFTVSGGRLFIQQGAGPVLPLTSPAVVVTEFTVDNLSPSAFISIVRPHVRIRYASDLDSFSAETVLESTSAVRRGEGFSN